MGCRFVIATGILLNVAAGAAMAQPPATSSPPTAQPPATEAPATPAAAPAPDWTGSAGAGLSLTSGNSSTSAVNASFNVKYDPKRRNVLKADGLYLRGTGEGQVIADRTALDFRDEYSWTPRLYVFGQAQYFRDTVKEVDGLLAPTAGLGFKLLATNDTQLTLDGSAGAIWEKDVQQSLETSGALAAEQKLGQKLSGTSSLTESLAALWKTEDFSDALYTFSAGVTSALTRRTQLQVQVVDTFKNLPATPGTKKNDVALVASILFKL
jgi:putative salt-induced outer membrane protein YdiY